MEKIAVASQDDPELATGALMNKLAADADIFGMIKESAGWMGRAFQHPLGKALAWGVGLGVPAAGAGGLLLAKAREDAEAATADIRNKILQSALGVAGIGAGLYGLHRLTGGKPLSLDLGGEQEPPKQASTNEDALSEDALQKLATVGAIEALLDDVLPSLEGEAQKLATEVQALNRGYGVELLYELSQD
jgi:hypothetical protein